MAICGDVKRGVSLVSIYAKLEQIGNIGLRLLWRSLHFLVSIFYSVLGIADAFESYIISTTGLCSVNPAKIKYLGIVVESEEAVHTSKVVKLLSWLYAIGVNHICIYDEQGVMKRSQKAIMEKFENVKVIEQGGENDKLVGEKCMTLEFASSSDGKEAVVKAANVLLGKYMELAYLDEDQRENIFTEAHMTDTLKAIGINVTEPDLLLVYGPARCHLGFPAWRIRYTEIVHMGSLKSLRYGSLVKAVYRFTTVRQNYGK